MQRSSGKAADGKPAGWQFEPSPPIALSPETEYHFFEGGGGGMGWGVGGGSKVCALKASSSESQCCQNKQRSNGRAADRKRLAVRFPAGHWGIVLLGKIMILQGVGHPISCLGVCYANDPQKGGYTTPAPALDLTPSLRGDFAGSAGAQIVSSKQVLTSMGGWGGGGSVSGLIGKPPPPVPWVSQVSLSRLSHVRNCGHMVRIS